MSKFEMQQAVKMMGRIEELEAQLKEARADAVEYADALLDTLDGNHRYDIKDMTGCSIERCIEIETLLYGSTAIIEKYKEKK